MAPPTLMRSCRTVGGGAITCPDNRSRCVAVLRTLLCRGWSRGWCWSLRRSGGMRGVRRVWMGWGGPAPQVWRRGNLKETLSLCNPSSTAAAGASWRRERHAGIYTDGVGMNVGVRVCGQVNLKTVLYKLLFYQSLRTCGGGHHPLIVVGVHTDAVVFQVEGELTELDMFEFVLVQVGPTPQTSVDHMRETFTTRDLQPSVQCPLDGHTLAWMDSVGGDSSDE